MSFRFEGEKCPACHAYLFEDDDIVCCPVCGAPHHRDCYNAVGHCVYEDAHGTELQYDRVKKNKSEEETKAQNKSTYHNSYSTARCKMCGEEFERNARSCPRCGAPNMNGMNGFATFDFLGGVPAEVDIGEGVTAEEAKRFVVANTPRYIPKFAAMATGKKASWNWLAFLFPWVWFASRKMYLYSVICGILGIASTLVMFPFTMRFSAIVGVGATATNSIKPFIQIFNENPTWLILFGVGMLISLAVRIVCGILGDGIYRKHVISSLKKIHAESEDQDADYRKKGGVSFLGMLIAFFAGEYLPMIIASFLL